MHDRNEIANCVGALAVHVDARRWDDLLNLFAPEVQIDYTSLFGGERELIQREALIARWRALLPGFTQTTHLIGPPVMVISGVSAQVSASVAAWHFIKEPALAGKDLWLVGGCYEIQLTQRDAAWRISGLTLARAWSDGNSDLPRLASMRAAAQPGEAGTNSART